jgi:DNA polymerase V
MLEVYFSHSTDNKRPFIGVPISCGDPLENDAPIEWLSLDDYVSSGQKDALLYVRVCGESMIDVGITHGDLVVVDRLKRAETGMAVLARLGPTYTIKKFSEVETYNKRRKFYLVPANSNYKPRKVKPKDDFEIIGVVTHLVKKFC